MSHLTLLELNNAVSEAIEANFNDTYWLAAEISEARVASNGHCYLEFVEKDELGLSIVARARANIWRNVYQKIAPLFSRTTGSELQPGMSILAEVSVNFHPAYGYSLTIHDIDPTYTLGDIAKRRMEILQKLNEAGIAENNKRLTINRPIRNIAVISSASAAGYGDFMNQLEQSGYAFHCKLFSAIMQGDATSESCINALSAIRRDTTRWDCVVIIRGGGAAIDLYGFERYELAAEVAQFPIPVLTGIGHERDETVLDYVAHTRLKTPTAVAAFLIEKFEAEIKLIKDVEQRLHLAVLSRLDHERHVLEQLINSLNINAQRCIRQEAETLERLQTQMRLLCKHRLQHEQHCIQLIEKSLKLASPSHILSLGYSLTKLNGKVVTEIGQIQQGDIITTTLINGSFESRITKV